MEARDRLVRQVANELSLSFDLVEKVAASQFEFLAEIMRSGSLEGLKFQYLGRFLVRPRKLEWLKTQSKWVEKQERLKEKYAQEIQERKRHKKPRKSRTKVS